MKESENVLSNMDGSLGICVKHMH